MIKEQNSRDRLINMRDSETSTDYISAVQQESPLTNQVQLFSIMCDSQQGTMEEHGCSLDASKKTSPSHSFSDATPSPDQSPKEQAPFTLFHGSEGFSMNKKRYNIPQIVLTPGSPAVGRRVCSRPASPTQQDEEDLTNAALPCSVNISAESKSESQLHQQSNQKSSSQEQEQLFSMVSHSQRGRMDEQRCVLGRTNRTSPASNNPNASQPEQDPDELFRIVASSQSRRLDDQRVYMRTLPGLQRPSCCSQQNGNIVTSAKPDSNSLRTPKTQHSRMGEEHSLATAVKMMLGPDVLARKAHSRPPSPTLGLPADCKPPKRSSSFTVCAETKHTRPSTPSVELAAADQEKFLRIMMESQRGTMDEQRCPLNPSKRSSPIHTSNTGRDSDPFFKFKASDLHLDDQRAAHNLVPSPKKTKKGAKMLVAPVRVTPGSPATPRKGHSRPVSPTQKETSHRPTPRSASFCPISDKEKMQDLGNQTTQVTFQVSMSFTPQQIQRMKEHQCALPEVFLTLGPPGESVRVPLSPVPSRPTSLALSPVRSPHPSRASPRQAHSRDSRPRPPSPCRASPNSSTISPDEDYFSLIQRIHTTQIQKTTGRGETGKGKEKGDGRKEGRDGTKKKR